MPWAAGTLEVSAVLHLVDCVLADGEATAHAHGGGKGEESEHGTVTRRSAV